LFGSSHAGAAAVSVERDAPDDRTYAAAAPGAPHPGSAPGEEERALAPALGDPIPQDDAADEAFNAASAVDTAPAEGAPVPNFVTAAANVTLPIHLGAYMVAFSDPPRYILPEADAGFESALAWNSSAPIFVHGGSRRAQQQPGTWCTGTGTTSLSTPGMWVILDTGSYGDYWTCVRLLPTPSSSQWGQLLIINRFVTEVNFDYFQLFSTAQDAGSSYWRTSGDGALTGSHWLSYATSPYGVGARFTTDGSVTASGVRFTLYQVCAFCRRILTKKVGILVLSQPVRNIRFQS